MKFRFLSHFLCPKRHDLLLTNPGVFGRINSLEWILNNFEFAQIETVLGNRNKIKKIVWAVNPGGFDFVSRPIKLEINWGYSFHLDEPVEKTRFVFLFSET